MNRDPEVQVLLDKEACRQLTALYTRALDRCDLELMQSLFHPEATFEHADHYSGSASGFAEMVVPLMQSIGPIQHTLGQHIIEVDGDRAYGEAYGIAFQRCSQDGKSFECFVGARIFDVYERRGVVWKILRRKTVVDWNLDIDTSETWGRGALGAPHLEERFRGRKDRADTVYEWFPSIKRK